MKIKVLLFGIIKDVINHNNLEINLPNNSTILNLKEELFKSYPELKTNKNFTVAVNEVYENNTCILQKNDIVALIPPVSGG